MRQHIPNFLTLTNLFCGCCATVMLLNGHIAGAAWFVLGSFFCDYTDGMAARALRISSPMGKELDSLADTVSFGVVPGMMFYTMLYGIICPDVLRNLTVGLPISASTSTELSGFCPLALPAFILSMFSAYRLAKFNLDTRQKHYFMGLSTPGCTLFVLGLTLAAHDNQLGIGDLLANQVWIIYGLVALLSYLLVSDIPMYGLKIRSARWQGNEMAFIFLGLSLIALVTLKGLGLSMVILLYILLSLLSKDKILSLSGPNAQP